MNKVKQAIAAAILAGSMALSFVGGASADGSSKGGAPAGGTLPAGSVTFQVDGPTAQGHQIREHVEFTYQEIVWVYVFQDNEWKYIAIRR